MGSVVGSDFYFDNLQFSFDFANPLCFPGVVGTYYELSRNILGTSSGTFGVSGSGLSTAYVAGPSSALGSTQIFFTPAESVIPNTSQYTIEAWIKPPGSNGGGGTICSRYSTAGGGFGFYLTATKFDVGTRALTIFHAGSASSTCGFSGVIDYDTWQQICVTYNNNIATFYKNGASIGTSSILNYNYSSSLQFRLGQAATSATGYGGQIGILRVWSKAFDSSQMQYLYTVSKQRYGLA